MEFAFIVIILAILGILKVLSDIATCPFCDGTGFKLIKAEFNKGETFKIQTPEICHACKGTGKKTNK